MSGMDETNANALYRELYAGVVSKTLRPNRESATIQAITEGIGWAHGLASFKRDIRQTVVCSDSEYAITDNLERYREISSIHPVLDTGKIGAQFIKTDVSELPEYCSRFGVSGAYAITGDNIYVNYSTGESLTNNLAMFYYAYPNTNPKTMDSWIAKNINYRSAIINYASAVAITPTGDTKRINSFMRLALSLAQSILNDNDYN